MRNKGERKFGECAYCGKTKPLSDDHVPPRNLFPKPLPNNLITVPSCDECNSGSSKDDEYFRLLLSARKDTGGHAEVAKVWKSVLSSLSKPEKVGFRKSVLASVSLIERITPSGLYIGKSPAINVDTSRINKVTQRIIKGLFYHEKRIRLPDSYESVAYSIGYEDLSDPIVTTLLSTSPKIIGKGVFSYRKHFLDEDSNESVWLMFFYEGAPFFGATHFVGDAKEIGTIEA